MFKDKYAAERLITKLLAISIEFDKARLKPKKIQFLIPSLTGISTQEK